MKHHAIQYIPILTLHLCTWSRDRSSHISYENESKIYVCKHIVV